MSFLNCIKKDKFYKEQQLKLTHGCHESLKK